MPASNSLANSSSSADGLLVDFWSSPEFEGADWDGCVFTSDLGAENSSSTSVASDQDIDIYISDKMDLTVEII